MTSKKRFAEAVLNGWEKFGIEISHWVVAVEKNKILTALKALNQLIFTFTGPLN